MGEADRLVTQTALAIRDADELEVAASVLDAALRRAKAEGWREAIVGVTNLKADMENGVPPSERMGFSRACNEIIGYSKSRLAELDARAAQIEEGE